MKSKPPMILAGGALLAGALAIVTLNRAPEPPPKAAGSEESGRRPTNPPSTAAASPARPKSARAERDNRRKLDDEKLVATYGESRVKLARHVSGGLAEVFENLLSMGDSLGEMMSSNPEQLIESLGLPGQELDLSDEQKHRIAGILAEHGKRTLAAARESVDNLKEHPEPLMEMFLAGDALKRGKMDKDQYDQAQADARAKLDELDTNVEKFLENPGTDDPLKDETLLRDLQSALQPRQRETLQAHLDKRAAEPAPSSDSTQIGGLSDLGMHDAMDLEEVEKKVNSAKKLSSGFKSMLEGGAELLPGKARKP